VGHDLIGGCGEAISGCLVLLLIVSVSVNAQMRAQSQQLAEFLEGRRWFARCTKDSLGGSRAAATETSVIGRERHCSHSHIGTWSKAVSLGVVTSRQRF
jgi:hypothetical protein